MNKIYVGIDVGSKGAISVISDDDVLSMTFPKIGKEYDLLRMNDIFKGLKSGPVHVVIENVHKMQKEMSSGDWSMSRCKAFLEMGCVAHNIPFTLVHSRAWQKEMWQGVPKQIGTKGKYKGKTDTKAMSLIAAKRLFPEADLRDMSTYEPKYYADNANNRKLNRVGKEYPCKRGPHDGIVDALLMAEYCRRKFQ